MMMLRSSLTSLLCTCSLLSTSAFAATASIYFSPSLSYINIRDSVPTEFQSYTNASRGLMPKFALGVSWTSRPIGGFYLGLEAIAMPFKPLKINQTGGIIVRPTYIYGANILPGVSFDHYVKGYARLGAVTSSFKTFESSRTGYQVGAGVEWSVSPTWSVRADYIRTIYRNFEETGALKMDEYSGGFVLRFC